MGHDKDDKERERVGGGTGSRSAGSGSGYMPPGGPEPGSEGGPDVAGQTPRKRGIDSEEDGPHAGTAA